jgi:hypothetical protein
MRRSISSRRVLAVSASVAMAAGLAWLPAGPASAAVSAQFAAAASASTSASCTLTSGAANPASSTSNFSSGTRTHTVNLDAGFTNTGDSTDTVNMIGHYSSTMKIAKQNGNLSKAVMTGQGSVSIDASKGSATACDPTALVAGVAQTMTFTEQRSGWLYVHRQTVPKAGLAVAAVANNTTGGAVVLDIYQGHASDAIERGFVKPGSYGAEVLVGLSAGNEPLIFLKGAQQSSISMQFFKAGSALTGTKGAGKKYVEFPGSISCGTHKATLRWKASAGKVASGAFFVNGAKKASDSTPRGGEKIVLRHLNPKSDIKISAKLQLKAGGGATASRSYVPCKA